MILVGNQRGNARELAHHLMKDENERVVIHELRGFIADTLDGAFQESQAISRATRCQQHLFSMSFNPPKDAIVSEADFESAIACAEQRLGLIGQPRAVVFHEKMGRDGEIRRHAHAVWCRIDPDNMRAIQLSHTRQKMQSLARELYVEHDWDMPRGFVSRDFTNPRNYTLAEWQQAKRARQDPERLKAMFQDCWATTDSQAALTHALEERGFVLARGDRRGVVVVDHEGEVYALARWVGVKTKKIRDRVSDSENLPDVRTAHAHAAQAVTKRVRHLRKETGQKARSDLSAFSSLKRALLEAHTKSAEDLLTRQKQRATTEQLARDARFRRGWRGLLDRLIGQHGKTKLQNVLEANQSAWRDATELSELHAHQQIEKETLSSDADATRQQALKDLSELRQDFRRIARQVETAPEPTPQVHNQRRRRRRRRNGPS